jgi:hypothetical protein
LLRAELLARVERDQAVRKKIVERIKQSNAVPGSKEFEAQNQTIITEGRAIDLENRQWLKKIVAQHGWPGRTLVGRDGAQAAFLLAQHADHDLALQKTCLELMQKAPVGEVDRQNMAYLTDRVRLAEGRGQLYGTQIETVEGRWQPRKVDEPEKLDERRKSAGLPPIAEYLREFEQVYGPPKQPAARSTANDSQ